MVPVLGNHVMICDISSHLVKEVYSSKIHIKFTVLTIFKCIVQLC